MQRRAFYFFFYEILVDSTQLIELASKNFHVYSLLATWRQR